MTQIENAINDSGSALSRLLRAIVLCMLVCLSSTGCVSFARATMFKTADVSDKPELHGNLKIGEVYKSETYLFLQNDQDIGKEAILVTPGELGVVGGMEYGGPQSLDEYLDNRDDWPQVLGIVEQGTLLEVTAVRKVNSAFGSGWTYPIMTIKDGEFAGRRVNIVDLVKKCHEYESEKVVTHCVDNRLLSRVYDYG